MLNPRYFAPIRASLSVASSRIPSHAPTKSILETIRSNNSALNPSQPTTFVRHATHQAQGRANGAKDGAGRRLGAKKTGEQYVIPGNIIFRQRGTNWFPGENCAMGRDHTIYATETGYVKYYRDPRKHPKRQYIGVAFERNDTLPYPINGARRRRLGMYAAPMDETPLPAETITSAATTQTTNGTEQKNRSPWAHWELKPGSIVGPTEAIKETTLTMKGGYVYREANWEIGRAAERANIQVREFVPGDRFAAWRKRTARRAKAAERRTLRRKK